MKTRKQRQILYDTKYTGIPKDYNERLLWMYEYYKITPKKEIEILNKREDMIRSLSYLSFNVVLYEEPVGTPRPRARLIMRNNLAMEASMHGDSIHIYSPNAKENHTYMERLMDQDDFNTLNTIICTPCDVEFNAFFPTPTSFSVTDTFLAEIGLIRPPIKIPDWDNIGKCYSDMYNSTVWLDDALTIDGSVHKYFSILPRVEINLKYLNMVYTYAQYKNIIARTTFDPQTMNLQYYQYGGQDYGY